jgi:hypothetical protein
MSQIELVKIAHPSTALKILAGGVESLDQRTKIKLLAERMRQQMQEAAKQQAGSPTGIVDFAKYRRARTVRIGRNGTSQMMSPSGKDNYGEYAPLARREMI